jgi:hypothetical protein
MTARPKHPLRTPRYPELSTLAILTALAGCSGELEDADNGNPASGGTVGAGGSPVTMGEPPYEYGGSPLTMGLPPYVYSTSTAAGSTASTSEGGTTSLEGTTSSAGGTESGGTTASGGATDSGGAPGTGGVTSTSS